MQPQFWQESWIAEGSKTSFHRPDVHPYLFDHAPAESLAGLRVFVPLAGKTNDLEYFRRHAAHTVGIELVEKPVRQFLAEQHLEFEESHEPLHRFHAERLTFICGDIFDLSRDDVGPLDLIYDRASLIAFPDTMRRRYLAKIDELAPVGCRVLLNTLEYAPLLPEPPFSLGPADVARAYGDRWAIEHLESSLRPGHGMQRKFGLRFVKEHLLRLTKLR